MRVGRYFAFVDLCGFTRFTDTHGDEQSVAVLTAFRAAVRQVASDHGVRVAKWLGDGVMFVSTEGAQLVAAVVELEGRVDTDLPIRAGLAGGDVILFEGDDYIGGPVNLAARLCDAAQPHELLADADIADVVPDGVETLPGGPRMVPGFVQPVETLALGRPEPITGTHEAIAR